MNEKRKKTFLTRCDTIVKFYCLGLLFSTICGE